ncbi:uncharacterized protein YeaO (DUF488 family) [Amycolatopsis echigonensis]|uniref:Uncharacterized protein YeaO (DUF488 family) n=1 Tax=Amycolatopsis echigonensis TaxID=2576905 RepID=A0A2N3X1A0_9PSEU|nr:uncharacterized protein YeaO (DUF488 family) [Amycolatopsis niigatensis]
MSVGKERAVDTHVAYRRIYDQPARSDGVRVLVDRVWPRGVRKENAHLDEWLREVAPSTELRQWYGHDPERFAEFRRRYLEELGQSPHRQAAQHLCSLSRTQDLTLLTATRDVEHSQAAVLAEWLDQHSHHGRGRSS